MVQQPTLTAHAGPEEVRGRFYEWLLEHPDRATLAWRRIGVPCVRSSISVKADSAGRTARGQRYLAGRRQGSGLVRLVAEGRVGWATYAGRPPRKR